MYNSQNLPVDVTYPCKQTDKPTDKSMVDMLSFSELQALNLNLARRDYIGAIREQRKSALQAIDNRWVELLAS